MLTYYGKYSKNYSLVPLPLEKSVVLKGFSKENSKISKFINVNIQIDSVFFQNMYVINELVYCDILIGRKVTERTEIMYTRVGDAFTFSYINKSYET